MSVLKENFDFILAKLEAIRKERLNNFLPPDELSKLIDLSLKNEGAPRQDFQKFLSNYIEYSVNTNHDMYLNQLWSRTQETSVLGELLSSLTNTSMYTYEAAPVATLLERKMLDYLTKMIWEEVCDGIMTSGGTASNLQALLAARNSQLESVKNKGLRALKKNPVILTADNCHYSIKRTANILGLGQEQLVEVETNNDGVMTVEALKKTLRDLDSREFYPFCIVSTAGSTVEGSFDDIESIGKICKEKQIWFHVDAAYGGSALLSDKHKKLMNGIELADSVTWDFHKMLGLNLPCAFLLTKEKGVLQKTLSSDNDSYLFHDVENYNLGVSSLQCGRRNDILKLWLTWLRFGSNSFEKRVNRLFEQSIYFTELIQKSQKFNLIKKPHSINVCFRYASEDGSRKEEEIRTELLKTGKLMVNYSKDKDGHFFRIAFTNPDLENQHLDQVLKFIEEAANKVYRA